MKVARTILGPFFLLIIILSTSISLYAHILDTTSPEFLGYNAVPRIIHTETSSQAVAFTLHVTDDISGFNSGSMVLSSPSGSQSIMVAFTKAGLVTGNPDRYESSATFPKLCEPGLWQVTSLSVTDNAGNTGNPDVSGLGGIQVANTTPDTAPPLLASLEAEPYLVNVFDGAKTVVFTLHIADDNSGFDSGTFTLSSTSGSQKITAVIDASHLKTGNANDGIYELSVTFPQSSETGTWRISSMELTDKADNTKTPNLDAFQGITVVSLASDSTPPELARLQVLTPTVNVYEGPKPGIFALYITDDLTGFSGGSLTISSPSGNQSVTGTIDAGHLISGSITDGVFKLTVTFPQFCESGTWKVTSIELNDEAGNTGSPDVTGLEGIKIVLMRDYYILNVSVIGEHGYVKPTYGEFKNDYAAHIAIDAWPDKGYRVKAWTGTDYDPNNFNTKYVTMTSDRTVTVEFEPVINPEEESGRDSSKCFILACEADASNSHLSFFLIAMAMVCMILSRSARFLKRR